MSLQNRVDPFGQIHAVQARGMFTGNRGIIHDPATRTLLRRRWTTRAWIICACQYNDRPPRDVMGYNRPRKHADDEPKAGWTELFFLDEVTALAAGHRPCFTCRREAARRYAAAFADTAGIASLRVADMDDRLHRERLAAGAAPRPLGDAEIRSLPDGAMIAFGPNAFAIRDGALLPWGFAGYGAARASCRTLPHGATLVTPPTTVAVLRAGYRPAWHGSAFAPAPYERTPGG